VCAGRLQHRPIRARLSHQRRALRTPTRSIDRSPSSHPPSTTAGPTNPSTPSWRISCAFPLRLCATQRFRDGQDLTDRAAQYPQLCAVLFATPFEGMDRMYCTAAKRTWSGFVRSGGGMITGMSWHSRVGGVSKVRDVTPDQASRSEAFFASEW